MSVNFENKVNDKNYFKSYLKKYLEYQIKLNNELLNEDLDFITLFEIAAGEIDISKLPAETNGEEILLKNCQNFYLKDIFEVLNKGGDKNIRSKKKAAEKLVSAPNISNQEIYPENSYGKILLIGAKNNNNGVVKITTNEEKVKEYEKCLTLNKTGNGGAGLAFYQENIFISTSTVFVLSPKQKVSKYSMIYLAALLSEFKKKYNFGFSMNNSSIETEKIKLPAKRIGSKFVPDYSKMSNFIKSLRFSTLI
jgi:hypothetical protein